ncbi:MAG TPA: sigma-70 family RNA polymerase sigma factor [Actinomycetota bacterium]|nr:sigma-70 family RNA polymerase sigma factor [Actinomycetota bacterium]
MADRARFEAFFREHFARATRACTLVVLDPTLAEEVAAEAFTRLWSRWGQIESEDHAAGYVFKTAMRVAWRQARARKREHVGPVPEISGPDEIRRSLDRRAVFEALSRLPIRERQAVTLRDWAGFETRHVASMLGINESTVRVHLARGRVALRRSLSVEEKEP